MEMLVYKITNITNQDSYIGQTTKTLKQRWKQHLCQTRYVGHGNNRKICRYLHTAMVKYGIENFKIEMIDWATNLTELNYKEWLWINKLNTVAPNGYNLKAGGGNKHVSNETRKLLSLKLSGNSNGMYGKKGSEKQKEWIRKYNSQKVITQEMIENMKKAQQLRSQLGLNKGLTRKKTAEEKEKVASKLRKKYTIISPNGLIFRVSNVRAFCNQVNLTSRAVRKAAQLNRKYKGWKIFEGFQK